MNMMPTSDETDNIVDVEPLLLQGEKVLIFTQFKLVLDIMENYLKLRQHEYLRLDGSTPVSER